jgi:hypothetical protein
VDPQLHSRFWNSGFSHGKSIISSRGSSPLERMLFICEQFSSTSYNLYYMCLNYLELLEVPKTIGFPIGKHPISSLSIPSPDPWHSPAPTPPSQISVTALGPLHGMPELYILRQATQQGSPALLMTSSGITWRLIPLSKWVITPVINGIRSGLIPSKNWGELSLTHLRAGRWAPK